MNRHIDSLIIPSVGLAESGSAISALIPQTIVVSPILTSADPSAVDIDPMKDRSAIYTGIYTRAGQARLTNVDADIPPAVYSPSIRSVALRQETLEVFVRV